MPHTSTRGFIGLVSLIIVSLLMALFYWSDVFSGAADGKGTSVMERNLNAIQAAKDVKQVMDERAAAEIEQLAN